MKEIGFNNTGVILHMIFNDLELYKTDLMKFFYITKIYIYIYIYTKLLKSLLTLLLSALTRNRGISKFFQAGKKEKITILDNWEDKEKLGRI